MLLRSGFFFKSDLNSKCPQKQKGSPEKEEPVLADCVRRGHVVVLLANVPVLGLNQTLTISTLVCCSQNSYVCLKGVFSQTLRLPPPPCGDVKRLNRADMQGNLKPTPPPPRWSHNHPVTLASLSLSTVCPRRDASA